MRIAYFLTHPIQYQSPLIRHLRAGGMDVEVIYATDSTARAYRDAGFGTNVSWDIPLLEGYPHRVLFPGASIPSGLGNYRRYLAALSAALDELKPAAVWVHGWGNAYPLAALRAARMKGLPVLMRGETSLDCLHGGRLRRGVHAVVLLRLFRSVSQFLAIGTANRKFYRHHGVPEERIHLMPYAVDNGFFQQRCAGARPQREKLRAELGIEPGRPVVLFCAKLIEVKDPGTLIRAIGRLGELKPVLLLAGDGALRPELEKLAAEVASGLVKFLGFRNQTELPALYDLCDVFVLPSIFEPWGLVVNEVMNAGKPVIVSDKIGCRHDLVKTGGNGDVFPAGDVGALTDRLELWLRDPGRRAAGGAESLRMITRWGFEQNLAGMQQALKQTTMANGD
ncbi:MAG: glycosyltransferase family 4 protein [Verrucomicrobiaceae bacterium]|nr:glycosyltransferase family 4 protein [Verrucomicrobiaceae bacterium]